MTASVRKVTVFSSLSLSVGHQTSGIGAEHVIVRLRIELSFTWISPPVPSHFQIRMPPQKLLHAVQRRGAHIPGRVEIGVARRLSGNGRPRHTSLYRLFQTPRAFQHQRGIELLDAGIFGARGPFIKIQGGRWRIHKMPLIARKLSFFIGVFDRPDLSRHPYWDKSLLQPREQAGAVGDGVTVARGPEVIRTDHTSHNRSDLRFRERPASAYLARNGICARVSAGCRARPQQVADTRQNRARVTSEKTRGASYLSMSHKRGIFQHIPGGSLQLIYRLVIYMLQPVHWR